MNGINENSNYQIEIKNSKFICCLFKITNSSEVPSIINQVKNIYKDATHYCYAYRLPNIQKTNDDGEPGGTAGMPILNILESNNLINVLAVVVRYFGGIKLGAGGLVRAYAKSVKEALDHNQIISLEKGINVDIYFNYDNVKEIDYILKETLVVDKSYQELIKYNLNINNKQLELLKPLISKYQINENIYIKKND